MVSYSASIFTSVDTFTRVYSEYSRTFYHYVYKITYMYNKYTHISRQYRIKYFTQKDLNYITLRHNMQHINKS